MEYEYKVKQRKGEYEFKTWDMAKAVFDLSEYETVYEGYLSEANLNGVLEKVYYVFNQEIPNDFQGHSLSVGDLVEISGKDYYCDMCGWAEVPKLN